MHRLLGRFVAGDLDRDKLPLGCRRRAQQFFAQRKGYIFTCYLALALHFPIAIHPFSALIKERLSCCERTCHVRTFVQESKSGVDCRTVQIASSLQRLRGGAAPPEEIPRLPPEFLGISECLYTSLGLSSRATVSTKDVKLAYRKSALRWHPDKNPGCPEEAEQRFKDVQRAFTILTDPNDRAYYDENRERILTAGRISDAKVNKKNKQPAARRSALDVLMQHRQQASSSSAGKGAPYVEIFMKRSNATASSSSSARTPPSTTSSSSSSRASPSTASFSSSARTSSSTTSSSSASSRASPSCGAKRSSGEARSLFDVIMRRGGCGAAAEKPARAAKLRC